MNKKIQICFEDQLDVINPDELSMFLLVFGSAYRASAEVLRGVSDEEFISRKGEYLSIIRSVMHSSREPDIYNVCPEMRNYEISGLSFNSPLSIWAKGIISALAAAVIISGGKADVWGAKFEINSLGEGIHNLLIALDRHTRPRAKFSIEPNQEGEKNEKGSKKSQQPKNPT